MKINEPVTNNEVVMEDGQFIVSTTDLKGRITSINRAFVEISGFTEKELIGQSHNIVRHPDMPPEAFEDLWNTIKQERPWIGMVKNRCKNGDHYWVKANVTPLREHGRLVGYMSVRTKPSRQEIEQAESLYRDIRMGKASLKPGLAERLKRSVVDQGIGRYLTVLTLGSVPVTSGIAWLAAGGASMPVVGAAIGGSALLLGGISFALARYVKQPVDTAINALQQIASGDYFQWVESGRNDQLGRMLQNLQSAQIRLGHEVNEIQVQSNELSRVREALESAGASVMIADQDLNIIYLNNAVKRMMKNAESGIRSELSDFDADGLMGENVDHLFARFGGQPETLARLEETCTHDLEVGGRSLRVTASPIVDSAGRRLGTVVEWLDRTSEVAVEGEIQSIVDAALMGNLSERVGLAGKKGFFATLGRGVNELMTVMEKVIDDTAGVVGALARGDLSRTIDTEYEGSFARLKEDVNATIGNLTRVIDSIRTSADAVEHASREIAEGNTDLARRTEMQASNLEETASSMEEITSTVRQNADNSHKASELSKDTLEKAVTGGSVVAETIEAMEKITDSSKKIAAIIGVIDDIAFQTNLLALNAAVEAARAGEQGRGFAVVATEVRNLAQRSATAAKEIKTLIEDSVNKVQEGSELVDQSGNTLQEIVESVKKVNDFIAEIAAASSEQYAGIDQVNQAVSQMDEVTQQNATLVEQAAQTSQMMDEQAKELGELIAFFKTGNSNDWDGVERRSAHRPWSDRQANDSSELDFATARTKHKLWKTRLRAFLDGEESMNEQEAVSHHDCDLGKWLYGQGLSRFGDLPQMQQLEKIHAEMHTLIKQVVRAGRSGDQRKAEAVFARVERYSDEIVALLEELESLTSGGSGHSKAQSAPVPRLQAVGADDVWEEF